MNTLENISDRIQEEIERHKKRLEQLESGEVQRMIAEHEHWSKRLPILREEIEAILGSPLETSSVSREIATLNKKGKPNRPKKPTGEVLKEMVALLTDHPKGMKSKEIAELLNVGLPKIAEAISLNESLFEKREKGPKSVIQLKKRAIAPTEAGGV